MAGAYRLPASPRRQRQHANGSRQQDRCGRLRNGDVGSECHDLTGGKRSRSRDRERAEGARKVQHPVVEAEVGIVAQRKRIAGNRRAGQSGRNGKRMAEAVRRGWIDHGNVVVPSPQIQDEIRPSHRRGAGPGSGRGNESCPGAPRPLRPAIAPTTLSFRTCADRPSVGATGSPAPRSHGQPVSPGCVERSE